MITKDVSGTIIGTDNTGHVRFRRYTDGCFVMQGAHGRTVAIDKEENIVSEKTRFSATLLENKNGKAPQPFDCTIMTNEMGEAEG